MVVSWGKRWDKISVRFIINLVLKGAIWKAQRAGIRSLINTLIPSKLFERDIVRGLSHLIQYKFSKVRAIVQNTTRCLATNECIWELRFCTKGGGRNYSKNNCL